MNIDKLDKQKNIALIAHDHRKKDLIEWALRNKDLLGGHFLCGTGTTAALISDLIAAVLPDAPGVKALLRIAVLYDIPVAMNQSTADYLLTSPLMGEEHHRHIITYENHSNFK